MSVCHMSVEREPRSTGSTYRQKNGSGGSVMRTTGTNQDGTNMEPPVDQPSFQSTFGLWAGCSYLKSEQGVSCFTISKINLSSDINFILVIMVLANGCSLSHLKNTKLWIPLTPHINTLWHTHCHLLQSKHVDNHFTSHPIKFNHRNQTFKNKWCGYKLNTWLQKCDTSNSFCL